MSTFEIYAIVGLMEITYFGHSCFKIKTKTATVITDPYDPEMVGFKYPKEMADIVTISHGHQDHNFLERIDGSPFVVNGPGEYEVKDVSIFGIGSYHDAKDGAERGENTIYLIEAEGLRLCHLGDLGRKITTAEEEEINGVDILFVPVGGFFTIGPAEAVEVIRAIEPKMVMPMHFKATGINEQAFGKLVGLEDFLKEMGIATVQPQPKLVISPDKLPVEPMVVVLERKA